MRDLTPAPFDLLRAASLLRDFSEVGVRILAEAVEPRQVGRGTYVFRAGEPSTQLSFITKGTVQLLAREGGGSLGEVKSGDSLGGLSLLFGKSGAGGEHLLSAMAASDVELLELSGARFLQLQQTKPRACLKLLLSLAHDLGERVRDAKGPLREFLVWQIGKRQSEAR